MAFFNFLKTAIRVLTVVIQVLTHIINAYDAAQTAPAGA